MGGGIVSKRGEAGQKTKITDRSAPLPVALRPLQPQHQLGLHFPMCEGTLNISLSLYQNQKWNEGATSSGGRGKSGNPLHSPHVREQEGDPSICFSP